MGLIERAAFAYIDFRLRARDTPVGRAVRAMGLVAGYTLIGIPILVGGYLLKSAIGLNMSSNTHMGGICARSGWRSGK